MSAYEKIISMWCGFHIKTIADLVFHLNDFRITFAYNSVKIENPEVTYNATKEVFIDNRVKIFRGDPATLTEISNQRKCYDYLLPKIIAREPMSLALIKEAHEITGMGTYDDNRFFELGERPGMFKKHDFVIGHHEAGSLPHEVEGDMTNLLGAINSTQNLNEPIKVLRTAAYFHMCFEYIHPFAGGNGLVGRTLMNYFLMIHNHPPLIVHDEDRAEYYEALEAYDENEAIDPLFNFFLRQLEKTWEI